MLLSLVVVGHVTMLSSGTILQCLAVVGNVTMLSSGKKFYNV